MPDAPRRIQRSRAKGWRDDLLAVNTIHLRAVLKELGGLRQTTQEQAKAIRHTLKGAEDHQRNLGRIFANVAAMSAHRRNKALEKAITEARAVLFQIETFELTDSRTSTPAASRGERRFASASDLQAHLERVDTILSAAMINA